MRAGVVRSPSQVMRVLSNPSDNKRKVLDATDIVRLIGDHIALKPKGREYVCLCPFHDDHSPSMYVVPTKQIFHCFSCGAGGNAIDFAMRYHGMEFRAALEHLAERAGVTLERFGAPDRPSGTRGESSKDDLLEANKTAMRFFRGLLKSERHGEAARAAIDRRGISAEMVELFGLGCAADDWEGLLKFLRSKDLPLQPYIDAGLLKRRENESGCYDGLRNRLIFPIFDQIGRVVGFGGRRLNEDDEPKYLNSPESKVFDKGSTLFGLKQAQRAIQNAGVAIVTEGYTDVIACHQAGIANAVATLGTALTPKHAAVLRRLADGVILLFDGDEAGMKAADRALEVVFAEPIDIRVAVLPDGDDPDDLLKQEGGVGRFRAVLDGATDFLAFRFDRLRRRFDESRLAPGSTARARSIEEEIDRLVQLGLRRLPPVRQQTVIGRLVRLAGVDEQTVASALRRAGVGGPQARPGRRDAEPVRPVFPRRSASEEALGCLLNDPALAETDRQAVDDMLKEGAYGSPLSAVARAIATAIDAGRRPTLDLVLDTLDDPAARSAATALALEVDRKASGDHATIARQWTECVRRHRIERARRDQPVADEEPTDDLQRITTLLQKRRDLHSEHGGNPLALPRPRTAPT